jgi:hypothetical protein
MNMGGIYPLGECTRSVNPGGEIMPDLASLTDTLGQQKCPLHYLAWWNQDAKYCVNHN